MIIDFTYDSSVASAPAGFTAVLDQVASFFEARYQDPVTITIAVGFGEVNGQALSGSALGESLSLYDSFSYAQVKAALAADSTTATDASAVASLPASNPTSGIYWLTTANEKALNLGTNSGVDGYIGFRSTPGTFDYNNSDGVTAGQFDFFGVAAHEVTEVMGRQLLTGQILSGNSPGYTPLDLFHFSAPGTRIFVGNQAGYFSPDNGTTNLNNFNTSPGADYGDWAASAGHDAFLAVTSPSVENDVSLADFKTMDAIGWDLTPLPDLTVSNFTAGAASASFVINNTGQAAAGSSTAGVYLSHDKIITTADTLVGSASTPGLAQAASDPEGASLALPTNLTPGTYYLGVLADESGAVGELSETNNDSATLPIILGNVGANSLSGTAAGDTLLGFDGNDTLSGGGGKDTMIGGTGDDLYIVDNSLDVIVENPGEGTDRVQSSATYALAANVENLALTGSANINATGNGMDDSLTGNSGNNVLTGLGGADTLDGGGGLDTASYAGSPSGVNVSLSTGAASGGDAQGDVLLNIENLTGSAFGDTIEGSSGDNVLNGGAGTDTLTYADALAGVNVSLALTTAQNTAGAGTDTVSLFENLIGTAYADTLIGSNSGNQITGGDGNDSIDGGGGPDTMIGGTGDDLYVVDNAMDRITENTGEGSDSVFSSATFTLGANVENLTLTGSGNINGTGNSMDNAITGNAGNNVLSGLGGADTLDGGAGVDTVSYAGSSAGVNVSLFTGAVSGGDAQGDSISNFENVTGSSFNDTIEGSGGDNVLTGGAGTDTLSYANAGGGVTLSLAIATAQATGGAGTDTVTQFENLTGSAFGDVLTGSGAANTIQSGDGNDTVDGGGGNDVLKGGNDDDQLLGGLGNDSLTGGAGADTLGGGGGGDRFVYTAIADSPAAGSHDSITDFSHAESDKIDLSAIDANANLSGNQAFSFIGTQNFHNVAGELHYVSNGPGITVSGDVNGDGLADFSIDVNVTSLVAADFVL